MSDRPIGVSSCGHYKLINMEKFHTLRPNGRADWQLLYMASGVFEYTDGKKHFELDAPCIVLYSPWEYQDYSYRLCNKSEVYWIHFAGNTCREILDSLGLFKNSKSHKLISKASHRLLFDKIIEELQLKRPFFSDIANGLFYQLLGSLARNISELKNGRKRRRKKSRGIFQRKLQLRHLGGEIRKKHRNVSQSFLSPLQKGNEALPHGISASTEGRRRKGSSGIHGYDRFSGSLCSRFFRSLVLFKGVFVVPGDISKAIPSTKAS